MFPGEVMSLDGDFVVVDVCLIMKGDSVEVQGEIDGGSVGNKPFCV